MGLFEPWEQQEIINVGKALRHMSTTVVRDISKDTAGLAADAGINIVSRSAEFFTRWVIRSLGKGQTLERLLVDPKARKALIAMGNEGPDTPAFKAAVLFLTVYVGEEEARQEAQRRQEQLAEESSAFQRGE